MEVSHFHVLMYRFASVQYTSLTSVMASLRRYVINGHFPCMIEQLLHADPGRRILLASRLFESSTENTDCTFSDVGPPSVNLWCKLGLDLGLRLALTEVCEDYVVARP